MCNSQRAVCYIHQRLAVVSLQLSVGQSARAVLRVAAREQAAEAHDASQKAHDDDIAGKRKLSPEEKKAQKERKERLKICFFG